MTPLMELEVRASDIRKRLVAIGGMPTGDVSEDVEVELRELRGELTANESQQTAIKVSATPDTPLETRTSEGRGFRELIERANVGEIFHVAMNGGNTTGATAEMQKHYGLEVRSVPLAMLITNLPDDADLEIRATAAPANVGRNQQSIIPYVFPSSVSAFLALDMPSVPTGDAVFPLLTTAPTVGTPAEGVDATISDGTFVSEVLTPKRYQTFFTHSMEDRAKFMGMNESLRENLSEGMSNELDKQAVSGAGGLLTGTILSNHNVTAITDFDDYIDQFGYGRVDGRFANMVSAVRVVMGNKTYAHAGRVYRNTSVDRSALDRLMELTSGVMVSGHVPAEASNRQNSIIRIGTRRDFVQPVWDSVEIIPDNITMADSGTVKITAVGLFAQKLLRSDGFYKQQTQHA